MRKLIQTIKVTLVLVTTNSVLADFQYPEQGGEFRLTVVDRYPVTENSGEFMFENTVGLPAPILADVTELYQAIDTLPILESNRIIETSKDGRLVGVTVNNPLIGRSQHDQEGATGVWIFPDWRDASIVRYYPNFSRVRFLNGQYAMLIYDRPGDINTTIVDTSKSPTGSETYYWRVRGMWRHSIQVGSNGFWAAINWNDTLHTGQLGANPTTAAGQTVSAYSDLTNLLITRDGSFILLEPSKGEFVSVSTTTLTTVDTHAGCFTVSRMPLTKNAIGNNYFTSYDTELEGRVFLRIDALGSIVDYFTPVVFSKSLRYWSPTGAYAETKQHVMPPGAIELDDIRTLIPSLSGSGSGQDIPPLCGTRDDTDQVGWLYWD